MSSSPNRQCSIAGSVLLAALAILRVSRALPQKKADAEGAAGKRRKFVPLCLGLAALLLAFQVLAHHSGAMFDTQKSVTLSGTVKIFQWTNPHCWIQVLVAGEQMPVEWSVEMGSVSQLYNLGWKPRTLKPGDKIIVVIHPARDGSNGGIFVSGTDGSGNAIVTAR